MNKLNLLKRSDRARGKKDLEEENIELLSSTGSGDRESVHEGGDKDGSIAKSILEGGLRNKIIKKLWFFRSNKKSKIQENSSAYNSRNGENNDECELMDSIEQEKLVMELREGAEKQNKTSRSLFSSMIYVLLIAFFYCFLMMLFNPYILEHQQRFRSVVSSSGFLWTYLINILVCIACIQIFSKKENVKNVRRINESISSANSSTSSLNSLSQNDSDNKATTSENSSWRQKTSPFVKLAIIVSLFNLSYWLYIFLFLETLRPSLVYWWLPLSPIFLLCFSLYVDKDLRKLVEDVNYLEKLKYEHKKV